MKEIRKNENRGNKKTAVKKIIALSVLTLVLMSSFMISAYASSGVESSMTQFMELLFTITKIVGVGLVLWGVVQFVMALIGHDPNQRLTAIFFLAGGLIVFFAREIMALIGVSI